MEFTLGLQQGGLMEDHEWRTEHIHTVWADSLDEAKQKWAEETGHDDEHWDKENKTYWGWSVVPLRC